MTDLLQEITEMHHEIPVHDIVTTHHLFVVMTIGMPIGREIQSPCTEMNTIEEVLHHLERNMILSLLQEMLILAEMQDSEMTDIDQDLQ